MTHNPVHTRDDYRICDVPAIPRQQIIEPASRSDRYMERILTCVSWQTSVLQKFLRQIDCGWRYLNQRELSSNGHSRFSECSITTGRFSEDDSRSIQLKALTTCFPPLLRKFLVCCD
jgi:hypothetical protein